MSIEDLAEQAGVPLDPDQAIVQRAEFEFTADSQCRRVEDLAPLWIERWPHTTLAFWRSQARSRGWLAKRNASWQGISVDTLESFLQSYRDLLIRGSVALELVHKDALGKLLSGMVAPESYEKLLSAFVQLDKRLDDKRERAAQSAMKAREASVSSKPAQLAAPKAAGALGAEVVDTQAGPVQQPMAPALQFDREAAQRVARALLRPEPVRTVVPDDEDDDGTPDEAAAGR